MSDNLLLGVIIACEAAFWVVLFAGLAARYLVRWRKTSSVLLASVPLIDLVLLTVTVLDLQRGATATFAHGLAAAYIGFTVAFGSVTIQWADGWFAHRFADGQRPRKAPTHGWPLFLYELKYWCRCVIAVVITQLLVLAAIAYVDNPEATEALEFWFYLPLPTVVLWFIFGPLWSILFYRTGVNDGNST